MDDQSFIRLDARIKLLEEENRRMRGILASSRTSAIYSIEAKNASAGAVASFDFQNIPATFSKLVIDLYVRGDTGLTYHQPYIRFNNDAGANYDYLYVDLRVPGNVNTIDAFGQTQIIAGYMSAANAPASTFDCMRLEIYGYALTVGHKSCMGQNTFKGNNLTQNTYVTGFSGWWRSTSAINRVTVLPHAGNYAQYSIARLYGIT
jgi:hypothetical protein